MPKISKCCLAEVAYEQIWSEYACKKCDKLCPTYDEASFKAGQEAMAKRLYEWVICPMCYRLNPHHATMDNGAGCKSCQEKEEDCGGIKE